MTKSIEQDVSHTSERPKNTESTGKATSPTLSSSDLLEWLRGEIEATEHTVKAREQAETTWRGGTDKSWRATGCTLSRAERLNNAEFNGRMAAKYRRNLDLIRAIAAIVANSNDQSQT